MKNYYEILGVSEKANLNEIRGKYKELMKKNHPDLFENQDDKAKAEERCKAFGEAFNNLKNDKDRREHDEQIFKYRQRVKREGEPVNRAPIITISKQFFDLGDLYFNEEKTISFVIGYTGPATPSISIDWLNNESSWGDIDLKPEPEKGFPLEVIVYIQPSYNLIENVLYKNTLRVTIAKKTYDIVIEFKLKAQQVVISKNNLDLGLLKANEKKQASFSINYPIYTCNLSWRDTPPVWGRYDIQVKGQFTIVTVEVNSKDYLTDGLHESVIRAVVRNKPHDIYIKFVSKHDPKIEFSDLNLDFGRL